MAQQTDASPQANGREKNQDLPFIPPQPIREDQIQNAVKFLAHPKVKGSSLVHRRSFLEGKGLSREEIDEAFRRVPDSPSNESANNVVSLAGTSTIPLPSQTQPGGSIQAVVPAQQLSTAQIVGVAPSGNVQAHTRPHWLQLILGVTFLAAVGAGTGVLFQRVLVPKLKAWIRSVVLEENVEQGKQTKLSPSEEAARAATGAATAAAEVAKLNREMLKSRTEEWQHLTNILKSLENQTQELRTVLSSMAAVSQGLNVPTQTVAIANGHFAEPAGPEYQTAPTKSFQHTMMQLEQIRPRQGIQTSVKSQETSQAQLSNNIRKIEVSNGHAAQSTLWNQGNTSMVQGKFEIVTDHISQSDDFKEEPWWRQKKVESESFISSQPKAESTVQITEIDAILDGSYDRGETSSPLVMGRQGWAPPPIPQTVMPGVSSAIRYQKTVTSEDSKSSLISEEKDLLPPTAVRIEDGTTPPSTSE